MEPQFRTKRVSWFATGSITAAIVAVVLAILSGVGSRLDWWHFGAGFAVLQWSVYIAIAAVTTSLLGIITARPGTDREGLYRSIVALVIAAPVIVIPLLWKQTAGEVPPIHDISTNTDNPPKFQAVIPLRKDAPNTLEYGGASIANQQKQAYPDIRPFVAETVAPSELFDAALKTAKDLGWEIVAAAKEDNRIEATDTTFWFGFKDDVVITITPDKNGSILNIRSVSRVGRSDVGTNAERIRSFLTKLKTSLG